MSSELDFSTGCTPQLLYATKPVIENQRMIRRSIHKHDNCTELLYVYRGLGEYSIDGYHYPIHAGDILLYNQGSLHELSPVTEQPVEHYCFGIAHVQLTGLPRGYLTEAGRGFVRPTEGRPEIRMLSQLLYETAESSRSDKGNLSAHLLQSLLLLAVNLTPDERSAPHDADAVLANRIRQYIDIRFAENITLEEIAAALHISPSHASHVYKSVMGLSPIQYVIRCRIGEAQNLLIATDLPVVEIAAMVGYANGNHFNAIFRRKVGMPPAQYRKRYLESMHGKRTQ